MTARHTAPILSFLTKAAFSSGVRFFFSLCSLRFFSGCALGLTAFAFFFILPLSSTLSGRTGASSSAPQASQNILPSGHSLPHFLQIILSRLYIEIRMQRQKGYKTVTQLMIPHFPPFVNRNGIFNTFLIKQGYRKPRICPE